MKQCSKSTWTAVSVLTLLFLLLVIFNYNQEVDDPFLTVINEENLVKYDENNHQNNRIINIDISYNLQPTHCTQEQNSTYILIVTSYFGNVECRGSIRRTFRELDIPKHLIKIVFLLGMANKDKYTNQNAIENEHKRFGDILQGDFVESYKNLTYKHLMGLRFASVACPHAKYIVKIDDDIVLDVSKVLVFLNNTKLPKALLAGYVMKKMPVIREPRNKWFVKPQEFNEVVYPNFLSGWFYVTNAYTAQFLLRAANENDYFWIDDAFITGILARKLNIKHYDLRSRFLIDPRFTLCCFKDLVENDIGCDFLAAPNGGNNDLFYKMNKALLKCENALCKKRTKPVANTCKIDFDNFNIINGKPFIESFKLA